MKKSSLKVLCAMSGGIDSSVAVALLKKKGFDVAGAFMKLWSGVSGSLNKRWDKCCSPEAETRARQVANYLSVPFYVFNFEREFKKRVVEYFLKEYRKGRTPNPCVVCNEEIKFGLLLKKARELGFDLIATGHFARKKEIKRKNNKIEYKLLKAKDKQKDQSYFLWRLTQKQLACVLFPVGDLRKDEIKKLAKKFGLPLFDIPESQEICFVSGNLEDFLTHYFKQNPGKIIDKNGREIGLHRGLFFYTIGQRKGIKLPDGPYYVVDKDLKRNVLVVSKNKKDLLKKELLVEDINWISEKKPQLPLKVKVKIRYRHKPAWAIIRPYSSRLLKVIFTRPQEAVTAGQSAVFYKGQEVLGGGIIC